MGHRQIGAGADDQFRPIDAAVREQKIWRNIQPCARAIHDRGFVFAVVVLSISVISFPLLLDRDVGLTVAVLTSLRAVRENPVTMAIWGLIVAAVLAIGFLPLFVGLAVAVPILAHASWHLYRKVVEPATPV